MEEKIKDLELAVAKLMKVTYALRAVVNHEALAHVESKNIKKELRDIQIILGVNQYGERVEGDDVRHEDSPEEGDLSGL